MESLACLNCDTVAEGKFCSNCGQKTDTHRITAKHFFMHDLLHGVWHIEKGILFTIKQALIRPGTAALEYISGKRIKYYNVFYLILVIIGLTLLVNNLYDKMQFDYFNIKNEGATSVQGKNIDKFLGDYAKLIIYAFVPLFAFNSFLLFKRKKLNFSEHLIIAGMIFLGVIFINFLFELLYFTDFLNYIDGLSSMFYILTPLTILIYFIANYYRTFRKEYLAGRTVFKLVLFLLLLLMEILVILLIAIGIFTKGTFTLIYN
ncbi:DUF3667 domain-containing protein [Flavobacterium tegetincola]|uniref:DUF3667 domain-containing protein n=1 Tax=Flavobacterium tegetincola TaxID=150172 RepID=UPI0003F4CF91|nr:DUF3667 domain-containing protein [Flavobacterium tegetincola]